MQRRGSILFIILNLIVTAVVAFAVINFFGNQNPQSSPVQVITVEVRITNTPDPNATIPVRIVTATPLPGSIGLLPTGVLPQTAEAPTTPLATLDAQAIGGALEGNTPLQGTATALPENCILHVLQSGDTPFGVAEQYGADGFALMEVNALTDETATLLQVGDILIVPLEGCPLTAEDVVAQSASAEEEVTDEATEESTAEATAEATVRPTLTLPPTATNAQVSIVEVVGAGDVTREGVVIRNQGNSINLRDWTLSDADGNTYTFGERLVFSNASITLFTRTGQDTPILLFWNRSSPVFAPGDVVTLSDNNGVAQSTFRIPAPVNLP
jgi:LysM repeat protein